MSAKDAAVAMELELLGATETSQRLHGNGFESIETDGVGARALTGGRNLLLWDLSSGQRLDGEWLRLHPDGVRGLRPDPEGVALFEIASGQRICALEEVYRVAPPTLGPGDLAFHPAYREVREMDKPMSPRVWSLTTGKVLHMLAQQALLGAPLPGDRGLLVDARGTATLWDLPAGKLVATMKGAADKPIKLRVSVDGKRAVTIGKKGMINVWDLEAGKLAGSSDAMAKEYGGGARDHFELTADGRRALFASRPGSYGDHFVGVMDLASGALDLSWTTADEEREITAFAPFPGSAHLAIVIARTTRSPRTLEIWDVDRRALVATKESSLAWVLAVTPNRRVAVGGSAMDGESYFRVYSAEPRPGVALPAQPPPGAGRSAEEPPPAAAPADEASPAAAPAKKRRKSPAK